MKKYWLLIFITGSTLLLFTNTGTAAFEETNTAAAWFAHAHDDSVSDFNHPHTELKIRRGQYSAASNRNQRQYFSGEITFEEYCKKTYFGCSLHSKNNEASSFCKEYLFHIYPSSNFW